MSFRMASKEALKSKFGQHRVGAVIVKNGRVLSVGHNERRYSRFIGDETVHAEAAAVVKLLKERRFSDLVGSTCYVTRFTRGGRIGMARPCAGCSALLTSVGVSRVVFSIDENTTGTMKL